MFLDKQGKVLSSHSKLVFQFSQKQAAKIHQNIEAIMAGKVLAAGSKISLPSLRSTGQAKVRALDAEKKKKAEAREKKKLHLNPDRILKRLKLK